jgi:hypothetical protein
MAASIPYRAEAGRYVFHNTPRPNATSIQTTGVDPTRPSGPTSSDVIAVLGELGYDDPFPFDRERVVYCSVDADYVRRNLRGREKYPGTDDSVYAVIDVTLVDAPLYMADMGIISDLIDYRVAGPRQMEHSDTPEQAVEQYHESITPVATPQAIRAYEPPRSNASELIIDGPVPPEAVVATL